MHNRIRFTNSTKYAKIMIYFTSIILPFIFVGLILNGAPLINSINLTLLPILCSILFYQSSTVRPLPSGRGCKVCCR